MEQTTVFYSWQSDLKAAGNRSLIQKALEAAAEAIGADTTLDVEPVVDRDTVGLSGSPNIRDAIFSKIENAAAFVGDVTPINAGWEGRLTPNPNVLIELGYAVNAIGWSRIVMVLNTAYGRIEDLPFDLRGHRCLTYESGPDAAERAGERKRLQGDLREALLKVFASTEAHPAIYPAKLDVKVEKQHGSTGERHDYLLRIKLQNNGSASLSGWVITADVPTRILNNAPIAYEVRRTDARTQFEFPSDEPPRGKTLHPMGSVDYVIPYYVDTRMYDEHVVFDQLVTVTAYANGKQVGSVSKPFAELNNF